MGVLFLLGNGFDIGCGMKCSYRDVYSHYLTEQSQGVVGKMKASISNDIETWADFEMGMAEFAKELNSEDELLTCVRDMKKFLSKYLWNEQRLFKAKLGNNSFIANEVNNELARSFLEYYKGISHNIDVATEENSGGGNYIITFNYTDTIEVLAKLPIREATTKPHYDVIHIHGSLANNDINIGVDNEKQLMVSYEIGSRGKRGFLKPFFNEAVDRYRVEQAKKWIDASANICCFGLSLGDSDTCWRNYLIESLKKNGKKQLFIYDYSLFEMFSVSKDELLDIEENKKTEMLTAWGITGFDDIFSQIHIPCGKSIFDIDGAISRGIEKQKKIEAQKPRIVQTS